MALVVDSYRPSYIDVARFAREGAAGIAARENLDRSIGRQQDQQQFDAQIQQRYDAMGQQSMERAADRQFDVQRMEAQRQYEMQRMGLGAQLDAEQQAKANAEWERRSRLQNQWENEQQEFQYSTRQQAELRRIDERMADVEKMSVRGDLSPEEAQHARYQLQSQRLGIQPLEPKPRAMDQYPQLTLADGTQAWVVPGRNGAPSFRDIKTGEDVDERTAHQYRLKETEAQNVVKMGMAQENLQVKQAEAAQDMQIKQAESYQKRLDDLRGKWLDIQAKKVELKMKLLDATDADPETGEKVKRYKSEDEVDAVVARGFQAIENDLRNATKELEASRTQGKGAQSSQPQGPARVHSSQHPKIEASLAPGQTVQVIDENGDLFEITGNAN